MLIPPILEASLPKLPRRVFLRRCIRYNAVTLVTAAFSGSNGQKVKITTGFVVFPVFGLDWQYARKGKRSGLKLSPFLMEGVSRVLTLHAYVHSCAFKALRF